MASSSSKRGLAWPATNTDATHQFTKPGSKISWLYNWSPNPTPDSLSLDFIPMQWNAAGIEDLAGKCSGGPSPTTAILGFNEPERGDQSNLTPDAAAQAWISHVQPLRARGVRCGSPGTSSAPEGIAWLKEFLRLIRQGGSDVDFYCLHWYGETLGQFYDYMWSTYFQLGGTDEGKKVWITEFAPTNWSTERPLERGHVEEFARESCKYLDGIEWVERYAWFGAMRDTGTVGKWAAMLDGEGRLTELGKGYRDG